MVAKKTQEDANKQQPQRSPQPSNERQKNLRLKKERLRRNWTQEELAAKIGTTFGNVSRWENGVTYPDLYLRQQLCELFDMTAQELGLVPPDEAQALAEGVHTQAQHWNVPYTRNPFFTGRADVLAQLHDVLHKERMATIAQAITGLGGIGKTQTAIEYAYRYTQSYDAVLWANAESRALLNDSIVTLAHLLDLPEKTHEDMERVINAVKHWLRTHKRWLLVLDNVEDMSLIDEAIPATRSGHVLLTTRLQATGVTAQRLELEQMAEEEGALFLLRRAKFLSPDAPLEDAKPQQREQARELSRLMDGLPLALDQAAAYIEETACGLGGYLKRYRTRQDKLLRIRGKADRDHPHSVATTWSLSFERIERDNTAAADLLRLCAFLAPDAIPEEIIADGATELGPTLQPVAADPLELDIAIGELRKYSLMRRDGENQLLSLHRLVQDVVKEMMGEEERLHWMQRALQAVSVVFPEYTFQNWSLCQRCLPHALLCMTYAQEHVFVSPKILQLFLYVAGYLYKRGEYHRPETFLVWAIDHFQQARGDDPSEFAVYLTMLGEFYRTRNEYEKAEPLYKRAIELCESKGGSEHAFMATACNNLALLYSEQGEYALAEQYYTRSLAVAEKTLGTKHPYFIATLANVAQLYMNQCKYAQAEALFEQAIRLVHSQER